MQATKSSVRWYKQATSTDMNEQKSEEWKQVLRTSGPLCNIH